MKLATFQKGGVHPCDMKSLSKDQTIVRIPLPKELVISMSQHLGAPATATKAVGDRVTVGEKIGTASSFISADVHSPVDGTVTAIKKVTLANSACADALVIQVDEQQSNPYTQKIDYSALTKEELLAQIKDKGIVGMGGATFPAHVKMSIPVGKKVNALVINGVECEPYLTSDYRLMMEMADRLLEGVMICRKVLEPEKVIIGVEANKLDAVDVLRKVIAENNYPIEVMPLQMKYPQGDEKQLLKATINREIPSGKLPLDVGAVVVNAGTAHAIFEAIAYGKPLFERIVTMSGNCISKPSNIIAPIGTKIKDIIEFCGGYSKEPDKLISGGPMMGFAFFDEEIPVCKGTSGILAISDEKNYEKTACISCSLSNRFDANKALFTNCQWKV